MDALSAYTSESSASSGGNEDGAPPNAGESSKKRPRTGEAPAPKLVLLPNPPLSSSTGKNTSMILWPHDYLSAKHQEVLSSPSAFPSLDCSSRLAEISKQLHAQEQQQQSTTKSTTATTKGATSYADLLRQQHDFSNPAAAAESAAEQGGGTSTASEATENGMISSCWSDWETIDVLVVKEEEARTRTTT